MQPIGGQLNLDTSLGDPLRAMPSQPQKKKGGMFASGGVGQSIAGMIGDYLMQRSGMQPVFAPAMEKRREMAMREQQYQQHRQDGLQDYAVQQQLQQQYGAPPAPHYFEDNSGNQWAIGADGKPQMVHKDDLPFKLVPNGMGGVVPIDLRALMAQQGAPAAPVGKLTPIDDGGPTPQASGGFPRPF